jgi:trimethylamine-N-oxide reductase (cytochrome c)
MISSHPRYSFHTYGDAKDSTVNDITDHRVLVDGYYYWVMRINPDDARRRGIGQGSLIRAYNDRGAVVFVADIAPLMAPGMVKAFESNADFDQYLDSRGRLIDRSGCANVLTPPRPQQQGTEGMAANSCLLEIEPWTESFEHLKRA